MQQGMPIWAADCAPLAIAIGIGIINGIMIAFVEAPALFVTLAAGFVIYGAAFWFAPAWVVYAPKDAPAFLFLGAGHLLGIPMPIIVFAGHGDRDASVPVAHLDRTLYLCPRRQSGSRAAGGHCVCAR